MKKYGNRSRGLFTEKRQSSSYRFRDASNRELKHENLNGEKAALTTLLSSMLEHYELHTKELKALSKSLSGLGFVAEAEMIALGMYHYRKGNEMLEKAFLSLND